jgi:hypothetical protein
VEQDFSKSQFACHFDELLVVVKAAKALSCYAMNVRIYSYMFSSIVWRIYVGFVADIDIKILGVAPPPTGAGHAFPRQQHMCREGEVIYLCQDFFLCMMPSMDG